MYQNLHTAIPSTIRGTLLRETTEDITEDDAAPGKFTQPDLLIITNGVLPGEKFPVTSRSNPRKLNANSLANRERQFKTFIQHCASNGLKYEYIDVHFSHKDDRALEMNELIKRKVYEQAFRDFVEEAENPTNTYHHTYQHMKRVNHRDRRGAPKVISPQSEVSRRSDSIPN